MSSFRQHEQKHCVIIPSYNSGRLLGETLRELLDLEQPIIVVVDGSTDGSDREPQEWAQLHQGLEVIVLQANQGKGGAVFAGLQRAAEQRITHAVVFDSDGQHSPSEVTRFIRASLSHPEAMILGVPVFSADAPSLRVKGRNIGNWWTNLETWWGGINDSLFGFRVYPVEPALRILRGIRGGRRFDFDTQLAVRLYWAGVPPLNLRTPVHYPKRDSGGVSHFRYVRDNCLLAIVHTCLFLRSLTLIPRLCRYRRRGPLKPDCEA